MRKFLIASATALVAALGLASPSMAAGGGDVVLQKGEWSFSGPFGHFDKGAMQRGFQVYREVCAVTGLSILHSATSPILAITKPRSKQLRWNMR